MNLTPRDEKFLRGMKIAVDEKPQTAAPVPAWKQERAEKIERLETEVEWLKAEKRSLGVVCAVLAAALLAIVWGAK